MATGFKTWDAAGNLLIDTATRMSRVLGVQYLVAGSSGSIVDAGFATGSPYWLTIRPDITMPGPTLMMLPPVIGFSGTTLTYSLPSPTVDHYIVYGVY